MIAGRSNKRHVQGIANCACVRVRDAMKRRIARGRWEQAAIERLLRPRVVGWIEIAGHHVDLHHATQLCKIAINVAQWSHDLLVLLHSTALEFLLVTEGTVNIPACHTDDNTRESPRTRLVDGDSGLLVWKPASANTLPATIKRTIEPTKRCSYSVCHAKQK